MRELVLSLLLSMTQQTGLYYDGIDVPNVRQISSEQMGQFGDDDAANSQAEKMNGVTGVYDHDSNTIYLLDSLDVKSVYGRSVLAHELVHYLQFQNDQHNRVACVQNLERLAYTMQNDYLEANGESARFDKAHIFFLSVCADLFIG